MRVPFGKYRGHELTSLPDDYLEWLAGVAYGRLGVEVQRELDRRAAGDDTPEADTRTAALALVVAGYRKLAQQHHPDAGGDTATMQHVNQAREWLQRLVEQGDE